MVYPAADWDTAAACRVAKASPSPIIILIPVRPLRGPGFPACTYVQAETKTSSGALQVCQREARTRTRRISTSWPHQSWKHLLHELRAARRTSPLLMKIQTSRLPRSYVCFHAVGCLSGPLRPRSFPLESPTLPDGNLRAHPRKEIAPADQRPRFGRFS